MNDKATERLIVTTAVIQVALFFSIIFSIPIVRQVICFIYLLFIPGFFILRIAKLSTQDIVRNILFSAGLSLAFLMLIGFAMNSLYPIFGFNSPLAPAPVIITVSVITIIFCAVAYLQDQSLPPKSYESGSGLCPFPNPLNGIALLSLPLLSVLGSYIVVISGNNSILLILLIIISMLVGLVAFSKKISTGTLSFLILVIAVALLLHISLTSPYLVGYDVHAELNILDSAILHSRWATSTLFDYNSMLSVTILPLIFSRFLNIEPIWIFKIVDLLIYSLVPVALFRIFQELTSPKIAFLATFFFMSMAEFYLEMQGLTRQMIGELFLALLILLIVDKGTNVQKRRILSVIFGVALIVSHYSIAFIFMFFIVFVLMFSFLTRDKTRQNETINVPYVLFFTVVLTVWYSTFSSGGVLASLGRLVENAPAQMFGSLGGGVSYVSLPYVSPMHTISKYVFYIPQILIVIGLVEGVFFQKKSKFNKDYIMMAAMGLAFLMICIALPYFAEILEISRIYQLTLFFLSPFCILGGLAVYKLAGKIGSRIARILKNENLKIAPILMLVIIFFLFQSGFIYEVTGDQQPTSLPLSGYRADPLKDWGLFAPYTAEQEVFSARYLSSHMGNGTKTYGDLGSIYNVLTSAGVISSQYLADRGEYVLENMTTTLSHGSFIYLSRLNLLGKMVAAGATGLWDLQDISGLLNRSDIVYSNGESTVYKVVSNP